LWILFFPSSSQYVLQVPNVFSIGPHFVPYALPNIVLSETMWLQNNIFNTIFFVLGYVNKVHKNDSTQIFYFGLLCNKGEMELDWILNIYLRSSEIGRQS
jgi:hypothetical protein